MWRGSALNTLYERYSKTVFRRARTILADDDAAKDAMQEVFVRAMHSTEDGQPLGDNAMAWLYRVTTNLCLNRLRDAQRRRELLAEWRPGHSASGDPDVRLTVLQILEQVPEDLQDVAIYYYVDELSHREIAGILGVSLRTVGNRLATFHERVGHLLTKEPVP